MSIQKRLGGENNSEDLFRRVTITNLLKQPKVKYFDPLDKTIQIFNTHADKYVNPQSDKQIVTLMNTRNSAIYSRLVNLIGKHLGKKY